MTTIRENILSGMETDLLAITSISTVKRTLPEDAEELANMAATEMPMIAMVGGVPVPSPHISGRTGQTRKNMFISTLGVQLFTYFMAYADPDTQASVLLNDIWVKLYSDQTRGDLALGIEVLPQIDQILINPYGAFRIMVNVQYAHGIGGI